MIGGFKHFNIDQVSSKDNCPLRAYEAAVVLKKKNPRLFNLYQSVEFIDFTLDRHREQFKFIADLAVSGLVSRPSLISGLSARHFDRVDRVRYIKTLSDSVTFAIRNKYKSLYTALISNLEERDRYTSIKGTALIGTWDILMSNKQDYSEEFSTATKGFGVILSDNYCFTELDLGGLSDKYLLWATAFFDQLSMSGLGFTTLGSTLCCEGYFLEELLPPKHVTLNLDRIDAFIHLVYEAGEFDFSLDGNPHFEFIYRILESCLDFDSSLSVIEVSELKSSYYQYVSTFEPFTDTEEFLRFLTQLSDFVSVCDTYGYDRNAVALGRFVSTDYGDIEYDEVGCALKMLVEVMPEPINTQDIEVGRFIKACVDDVSNFSRIFIEGDEMPPMDTRLIYGSSSVLDDAAIDFMSNYEERAPMQTTSLGWTGAINPSKFIELLEGEALSNALMNGLYVILNNYSNDQRSSSLSVSESRSIE